jgi:glycosyltransferase involved in cell wall biosynthesis
MRVFLVAPHYPPKYVGGVELYTQRLATALVARGDQVEVAAVEQVGASGPVAARETEDHGARVWRLSVPYIPVEQPLGPTYRDTGVERWFERVLLTTAPSVVHLHSGYLLGGAVLAASQRAGIPAVVTLHDYWFICPRVTLLHPDGRYCTGPESGEKCAWCMATEQRRYRWIGEVVGRSAPEMIVRLLRLSRVRAVSQAVESMLTRRQDLLALLSASAAVLSPSMYLRELMVQYGVPAPLINLLRYGVEPRRPVRGRDEGSTLRVGYLGQVAPHKGVHVLIDAIKLLSEQDVRLTIHGSLTRELDYVTRLRRAADHDSRIVFAGAYTHDELDGILGDIDIVAVPSIWHENSPFVIHEARAAGLPVLASRLGGMAELVSHGSDGLLATPGDARDFAGKIRQVLKYRDLLTHLRTNVRPPPTAREEIDALVDIYRRVAVSH